MSLLRVPIKPPAFGEVPFDGLAQPQNPAGLHDIPQRYKVKVLDASQTHANQPIELGAASFIAILQTPAGLPEIDIRLERTEQDVLPMRTMMAVPFARPVRKIFVTYTGISTNAVPVKILYGMAAPGVVPMMGVPPERKEILISPLDGIAGDTARAPETERLAPTQFNLENMVDTGDNVVEYTLHTVGAEKYYRIPHLFCSGVVTLDPATSDSCIFGLRVKQPGGSVFAVLKTLQLDQSLLDMSAGYAFEFDYTPSTPYENVTATATPHAIQFFATLSGTGTEFRAGATGRVLKS